MKLRWIALIGVTLVCSYTAQAQVSREAFIADLLSQMTLEEKVGQMTNLGLPALVSADFWTVANPLILDSALMETYLVRYGVGSVQGKGVYPPSQAEWKAFAQKLQKAARENTRLGIPLLFGIDAVHGANYTADATIFPHQLGLGASFNPELVARIAEATTLDLLACGINWNFAPVLDLAWQPLWGRIEETFSADAYVTSTLGKAYIAGAQQTDGKVVTSIKHLVGYSYPFSGKDRSPAYISVSDLHQFFLPPFQEAIQAGASSLMLNSGSVNGIPSHIDADHIRMVKEEWGFEGFIISDWDDLANLIKAHRVASDYKEATRLAVMAGMDMCMVPYDSSFSVALVALVREGLVPMSRIDDAVTRILRVKYDIGLWDDMPTPPETLGDHAELALEAATESIVLLKNDGVLPLQEDERVIVAGPGAENLPGLLGSWSRTWQGRTADYIDTAYHTVVEALKHIGQNRVTYLPGSHYDSISQKDWVGEFGQADKIVLVLGEAPSTEKPSDIESLQLPEAQKQLIRMAAESGKPTVAILLQGRPRLLTGVEELLDGVVAGFYPGQYGGTALAQLLYGRSNFSGKLPYTYPRNDGGLIGYPYKGGDLIDHTFGLNGYNPLFPFGYGESYSTFAYNDFTCSDTLLTEGELLTCTVTVTNEGPVVGKETVQWYLQDEVASVTPVVWRMVGFEKIYLEPGESQVVNFELNKDQLANVDRKGNWVWEPGYFKIGLGPGKEKPLTHRFFGNVNMD